MKNVVPYSSFSGGGAATRPRKKKSFNMEGRQYNKKKSKKSKPRRPNKNSKRNKKQKGGFLGAALASIGVPVAMELINEIF